MLWAFGKKRRRENNQHGFENACCGKEDEEETGRWKDGTEKELPRRRVTEEDAMKGKTWRRIV